MKKIFIASILFLISYSAFSQDTIIPAIKKIDAYTCRDTLGDSDRVLGNFYNNGTSKTRTFHGAAFKLYIGRKVDSIYRKGGTDSIIYTINGKRYAVKDSIAATAFITHTIFTPTTGTTVTLVNNQINIINPTGAILALTIAVPSTPSNNDRIVIKFDQAVTTVTYPGNVKGGFISPIAGSTVIITYDSATTNWY